MVDDREQAMIKLLARSMGPDMENFSVSRELQWRLRGYDLTRIMQLWKKYKLPEDSMDPVVDYLVNQGFIPTYSPRM